MTARAKFEANCRRVSGVNQISGVDRARPRAVVAGITRTPLGASNSFLCFTRLCEKPAAISPLAAAFTPMLDECCAKGLD